MTEEQIAAEEDAGKMFAEEVESQKKPPVTGSEDAQPKAQQAKSEGPTDEELLAILKEEYGTEGTVAFTDDDVKGGGEVVKESGTYRCFVDKVTIREVTRKKDTQYYKAGSVFHWMDIEFLVKSRVEDDKEFTGRLWHSIRYEEGSMREYELYCIATRCKRFDTEKGRIYYPQAKFEYGGSVGMPILVTSERDLRKKRAFNEASGQYEDVTDPETGRVVMNPYNKITAVNLWDTMERHQSETKKAPTVDIPDDDDAFANF